MMDSPRFHPGLAKALDQKGGVSLMVLSHIDDVGDHQRQELLLLSHPFSDVQATVELTELAALVDPIGRCRSFPALNNVFFS